MITNDQLSAGGVIAMIKQLFTKIERGVDESTS
jgi:hypothetical protein